MTQVRYNLWCNPRVGFFCGFFFFGGGELFFGLFGGFWGVEGLFWVF